MHGAYPVGMLCCVGRAVLGNNAGSLAIVYENYSINHEHHGISAIFENGLYCGFSEEDAEHCQLNPLRPLGYLEGYRFTNVGRLVQDFNQGLFSVGFQSVKE
jgi:hypothetical protein